MKNTIWEKRIPTLLGIFFILIGIGLTSLLVSQGIIFIGKATPVYAPKNVSISNVTDFSFTVTYLTNEKIVGSINYGKDQKLGQIARDNRDQEENKLTPRKIHSITVRNLKPLTKYYFSITNGEETYLNEGDLYFAQTGKTISETPPDRAPMSGKAMTASGEVPKEALIFAYLEGSQTISTLLKQDGSYILPLNSLRTADFSSYFDFSKQTLKMTIVGDDSSQSKVSISINQNPVPTVTLSKDYNFQSGEETTASPSAQTQTLPSYQTDGRTSQNNVTISSPLEKDNFTDDQPEFSGTAMPNETVTITIHSDEQIATTVTADSLGNWTYRPTKQLSPGQHTITITSKDASGVTRTITRTFSIFELGSQVAEAATPSATPIFTPTPTAVPTALPTSTPTPIVVITPTATPTLTPAPLSSPTPTLAPTGSSSVTNFAMLGLAVAFLGVILFLLSRGSIAL